MPDFEDYFLQTREKGGQSYDDVERVRNLSPPQTLPPKPITSPSPEMTPPFLDPKDRANIGLDPLNLSQNELTKRFPGTDPGLPGSSKVEKVPATGPWISEGYNRKFNITDLKNKITGLNQLSKFYFDFPEITNKEFRRKSGEESFITKWYTEKHKEVLKNLYFYSENITVPMRGINTDPHTYANGFRFEAPTGSNYGDGDISITMIVDHKYEIYDFFMQWMNSVHDKTTGYFSFHNRYTTDLNIYQLNNIGIKFSDNNDMENMIADKTNNFYNYHVHLGNCYPKSVSAIEFKHESRDERVKITVNFTYEKVMYNHELTKL